jgi:hypothetical protein
MIGRTWRPTPSLPNTLLVARSLKSVCRFILASAWYC